MTEIGDIYALPGERPWSGKAADWLREEVVAQRERLILWVPVLIAAGAGLYFSLKSEPLPFIGYGVLALSVAGWGVIYPLKYRDVSGYLLWLAVTGLVLACLGFSAAQLRTGAVKAPVLVREIRATQVQGRVIEFERLEGGGGYRLILDQVVLEDLPREKTPLRVRINVKQKGGAEPEIGDTVRFLGGLNPPSPPAYPGGFDFQQYSYFKKIGAYGFSFAVPDVIVPGSEFMGERVAQKREAIQKRIEKRLEYPAAAIAIALMTGERSGIAEEQWEALRDSGLAHMLAISGLHVGLAAGVVFMVLRFFMALFPWFALRQPVKKYAAMAALIAAVLYTVMVGGTIPTIRAVVMTGIVLFAVMIDRVPFSLRLVAVAATVVLIVMPEALLGASFQMSFAAVTVLIYGYELMRPVMSKLYREAGWFRRALLYFGGICLSSVLATLATAPFSLFHFQQFSIYAVLSNLFAMPLMAFIVMPMAVLSYVLMPLGLDFISLWAMGLGIEGILSIAKQVQDLPHSTWTPHVMPFGAFLLFVISGLWAVLWRGWGKVVAALPVIVAIVLLSAYQLPDILVSSSGKLAAVRSADGKVWVNTMRGDRFTAEIWARMYGLDVEELGRWQDNPDFSCGEEGCRTLHHGRRVSLSTHPSGLAEDCAWADVIVSLEPLRVPDCKAEIKVGFFDLWRNGAYALWVGGNGGRVLSVADTRGERPWTGTSQR